MAKEKKEMNKKGTEETKNNKAARKAKMKEAYQIEAMAVKNEKKKLAEEISSLKTSKKAEKDKAKKKKLDQQIKNLKRQRKNVGKRDTFLGDVMAEMRLVRWPSKKEVVKYSIACLVFILFFALFFFGLDALFALVKDLID